MTQTNTTTAKVGGITRAKARHYSRMTPAERRALHLKRAAAAFACWLALAVVGMTAAAVVSYFINH